MRFVNCRYNQIHKCKYWLYLVVILKFYILAQAVITVSAGHYGPSLTTCNCVRLKDCKPYTTYLSHNDRQHGAIVSELIRSIACGFENSDVKVCCPTIELTHNHEHPHPSHDVEDVWVWQRSHHSSPPDENNLENVIDYKDRKTALNAPHVFYEESNRYNNNDKRLKDHNNYHYCFDIEHNHHHQQEHDFDSSIEDDHDDSATAIIFPDDKRYKQIPLATTKLIVQNEKRPKSNRPIIYPDNQRFKSTKGSKETDYIAAGTSNSDIFQNAANCGIPLGARLSVGTHATAMQGQFPWITRIAYINTTSQRISYRCSGSVISQLFVLTAAHCVTDLVDDLKLSHVRIGDASTTENSLTYGISDVIIHPNYDQPKYANDIALLRLIRLQNEENLTTICLPLDSAFSNADGLIDNTGVVAGWSNANAEVGSNAAVKYLRLPIVNNTQCAITYAKYTENFHVPIVITPAHLCARSTDDMRDVCQGDSGGPFMDDGMSGIGSTNGHYTLLGIVAFGPTACGGTTIPGVYMRVSSFIEWIVINLH